jgi:hypothetical protein
MTPTISNSRQQRVRRKQRNPRPSTSCEPCQISKLRCDRQTPCGTCTRRDRVQSCRYIGNRKKSLATQSIPASPSSVRAPDPVSASGIDQGATDTRCAGAPTAPAVEGDVGDYTQANWDAFYQRPGQDKEKATETPVTLSPFTLSRTASVEEFAALLPPRECCDYLVIQYFAYIAPMFHVLLEDSFQQRYATFNRETPTCDLSWLALMFAICSISVQMLGDGDAALDVVRERVPSPGGASELAKTLRKLAMDCLIADNFIFHYGLNTLEAVLLVTYAICHDSGVESAWTLLGKTIALVLLVSAQRTDLVIRTGTQHGGCVKT